METQVKDVSVHEEDNNWSESSSDNSEDEWTQIKLDQKWKESSKSSENKSSSSKKISELESNYSVIECMGSGSFGSVIKVQKRSDGSVYAIKIVDAANVGRETEICMNLATCRDFEGNKNITQYFRHWTEDVESMSEEFKEKLEKMIGTTLCNEMTAIKLELCDGKIRSFR